MACGNPVNIHLHRTGRYRVVTNTSMAADCLFERRPHKGRGEKYWKAVESCLADLDGKPSPSRRVSRGSEGSGTNDPVVSSSIYSLGK
ncbi:DUF982 domain-containing protein [Brucella anthropi]|jgi:Protein of unknown function (DUF982)|nr:DUF982 domain-containing protein [Ochrobactrum sp. MT180101]